MHSSNIKDLENRLWEAADHLRANSALRLNEFAEPVLGLIFLKFACVKYNNTESEIVSVGSLNTNLVHPREVFEPAVRHLAAQVIIAHNHPAGDSSPSQEDSNITKQLVDAGKLLGIEIRDHVIVSKSNYFSFNEHKLI